MKRLLDLGHRWLPSLSRTLLGAARWVGSRRPRVRSLKLRLTVGAALVAGAILIGTSWALESFARAVAEQQARDHVDELLGYFSGTLAESVAAKDKIQLATLSRAILDNGGVHALLVTDSEGNVVYTSRFADEQEPIVPPDDQEGTRNGVLGTTTVRGETFFLAARSMRFGDAPAGILYVWLNRTHLENRMLEANAFVYPIVALGCLLFVGLGCVVLHVPFRALKGLTAAAERLGSGDFSSRVDVGGDDEVASLCVAFNRMADGLSKAREEVVSRHLETIRAMISAVEAKDPYTQGHCLRVKRYASQILDHFPGLEPRERERIETAALLHDLGKIGIPDAVLLKAHRLSRKECETIQEHVSLGERILLHVESTRDAALWVRHHHERWDGLGYPDGLRGEAIPFASRVIAVADCIDAMLTDRPYRKALTRGKVVKVLEEGRGVQFDPAVVDAAIAVLTRQAGEADAVEEVIGEHA